MPHNATEWMVVLNDLRVCMKLKVKDGRQKFAANDARDTGLVFNKSRDALNHLASVAFILKGLPMLLHISTFINLH